MKDEGQEKKRAIMRTEKAWVREPGHRVSRAGGARSGEGARRRGLRDEKAGSEDERTRDALHGGRS